MVSRTRSPYAYVAGNPLNAIDPSGMCLGWIWGASDCNFDPTALRCHIGLLAGCTPQDAANTANNLNGAGDACAAVAGVVGAAAALYMAAHGDDNAVTADTTDVPALTPSASGQLIGWGTGQGAAATAQTDAVTANLTSQQVADWADAGLSRDWVAENLQQYQDALNRGGAAANNSNLVPRIALMQKILELWPS